LAAAAACGATPGRAMDWNVSGKGNAKVEYNDNVDLSPTNKRSAVGVFLTPDILFSGENETVSLEARGRADLIHYFGVDNRDSVDPAAGLGVEKRWEMSTLGVDANFRRQALHQSEIEDTGRVGVSGTRQSFDIAPNWSTRLRERDTLSASAGFSDVTYDTPSFTDFRSYRWNTRWAHEWSERQNFLVTVDGLYFRPSDGTSAASDSYGVQVGVERELSETFKFNFLVGARYLTSDGGMAGSGDGSSIGGLVQGGLSYAGEVTDVSGNVGRSIRPSGGGRAVQEDKVGFTLGRRVSEYVRLSLTADGARSDAPEDGTSSERMFLSVAPGVEWTITEQWSLSAGYRYRRQKTGNAGWAASNAANLNLQYTWP
jgi:opacity protein-like surface antigen